jgi:hypothetical protein
MEVHHPKGPVHGLRDLAKEVGIIVIGVLIALGAEQAVEAIHSAHQLDVERHALKIELTSNALFFAERLATEDCEKARLKAIDAALAAPGDQWKAAPITSTWPVAVIYSTPWREFPSDAWRNGMASGALSHMPPEEMQAFSNIYSNVADMHQLNLDERRAIFQILDLNQDLTLTPMSRDRYRKAVDDLKFYHAAASQFASETLSSLKAIGITPNPSDLKETVAEARKVAGACLKG